MVATRIVLGIARFLLAEQADPVLADAAMANTEILGVVSAIPGRAQADGVTELAFVRDLVRRGPVTGHLDADTACVGQGDHEFADEGVVLQFARQDAGDLGVGLRQRGTIRHR